MPIYEYVCQGCEARIEVKQRLIDPPLTTCERCGKSLTKVISAPGIMFKGRGWYVTDYSDKMKPPSEADGAKTGEASAAPEKQSAETKSTDSAPATTPAPNTAGTSSGTSSSTGSSGSSKASGTSTPSKPSPTESK